MTKCFAAVDLGASSGRVMLGCFGNDSFTLEEVHRFVNTPIDVDGVRCWDTEYLFDQSLIGLQEAVTAAQRHGGELVGIAVDSWGVDYGLVDAANELTAPARHYRAAIDAYVERANESVSTMEAYQRTGIIEMPINTCFQLIRDVDQGLINANVIALLTPDLWTAWLCGDRGAEPTIASTTGLLDWSTGQWAFDLMERWGIPRHVLPELKPTGSRAGGTLPEITRRIGATHPVSVFRAPAHDTACAFAAVTSVDDDALVISVGTWALAGWLQTTPILTQAAAQHGFTNETAADGSALVIRNLSGTWLLEECLRIWAHEDGIKDSHQLRARLLDAAFDSDVTIAGVIDCGTPALINTVDMPGELARLYQEKFGQGELTRAQTVRLVLESLAESFAQTAALAREIGGTAPREIVLIGGGSQISELVRLTQQRSGLDVTVSHTEATSIGNICVQAVAAGLFPDLTTARGFVDRHLEGSPNA